MPAQEQVRRTEQDRPVEDVELRVDDKAELKDGLDDLLEEIDSVLEENAEEFVAQYVQKGGE